MNKKSLFLIAIILFTILITSSCNNTKPTSTVRLNEVVHSIFYAPQYVAIEKGFFEENGINIELTVGQGADKSMTALLSDNADIALLGTEAGIYVHNEGREDYPIPFAQLTQKAGNFLVSRTENKDFKWSDVKGKTIIGGRAGGMPQLVLEYICTQNGINPKEDVEILTNLQFASTSGAFAGGVGDFTVEFEPSALALEKDGKGYVVASLGVDSIKIPYTVFMANKKYIEKNPEIIQKFTNSIYKAQVWVKEHSSEEIAEVIASHFPENSVEDLAFIIDRYKKQNTWNENPLFEADGFELIQDIMESGGELSKRIPYDNFVNTDFAKKALDGK